MKTSIWAFALTLTFLIIGCDNPAGGIEQTAPKLASKIGFAHQDCFAIKNNRLEHGQLVGIVTMEKTLPVLMAKVISPISDTASCVLLSEDWKQQNLEDSLFFYKLDLGGKELLSPSIAIVSDQLSAEMHDNVVMVDVDADKILEQLTTCTTTEGIRFSIWEGVPWKSKEKWTGYYYLGYDLEPTCPDINQ